VCASVSRLGVRRVRLVARCRRSCGRRRRRLHSATPVYRTTRTLGLEYNKLKSMAHRPDEAPAPSEVAQFVELVAPAPAGGPACRIEVEGPAGARMKIELPALSSAQLVVGLCQMVWGVTR